MLLKWNSMYVLEFDLISQFFLQFSFDLCLIYYHSYQELEKSEALTEEAKKKARTQVKNVPASKASKQAPKPRKNTKKVQRKLLLPRRSALLLYIFIFCLNFLNGTKLLCTFGFSIKPLKPFKPELVNY